MRADGTAISHTVDHVAPVNLLGGSLFKSIELDIGSEIRSELINTHAHYKNYLQHILSYGKDAKTHLDGASWFYMDEPRHYDNVENVVARREAIAKVEAAVAVTTGPAADHKAAVIAMPEFPAIPSRHPNPGFLNRRNYIKSGKTREIHIPIACDFFQTDRLYLPNFDIKLRLQRESDNFSLLADKQNGYYKIKIVDITLWVRYVEVDKTIVEAHRAKLTNKIPLVYPIKRTQFRHKEYPAGTTQIDFPNMFGGHRK